MTRSDDAPYRLASDEILAIVGKRLLWLREACDELEPGAHTQERWAAIYHINASTLSRWETGMGAPNYDILLSIALSTRVDLNYFFLGVLPHWMPDDLRAVLQGKHAELTTPEQFAAVLATQHRSVSAPRLRRTSRRRRKNQTSNATA
jgi:transcriptional regulator with XRE-family HTH domain